MNDTPRPARYSNEVTWKVAELLAKDLNWEPFENEDSEGYVDSNFAALVCALHEVTDWDGYNIARNLDDAYDMEVDASLVEYLDSAYHYQARVHQDMVTEWVTASGRTPAFKEQDKVLVQYHDEPPLEGTVMTVIAPVLQYVVYVPDHSPGRHNYQGTLLDEEKLMKVPEDI